MPTVSLFDVTKLEHLSLALGMLALRLVVGLALLTAALVAGAWVLTKAAPCDGSECFASLASTVLASLAMGTTLAMIAPLAAAVRATNWGLATGTAAALAIRFSGRLTPVDANYFVLGLTLIVASCGAQTSLSPRAVRREEEGGSIWRLLNLATVVVATALLLRGVYWLSQVIPAGSSKEATALVALAVSSIGVLAILGQRLLWGVEPRRSDDGKSLPARFPLVSAAGLLAWMVVLVVGFGLLGAMRASHAFSPLGQNPDAAVLAGCVIAMVSRLLGAAIGWAIPGRRVRTGPHAMIMSGIWVTSVSLFPHFSPTGAELSIWGVGVGLPLALALGWTVRLRPPSST